jgi:hypothetical protein
MKTKNQKQTKAEPDINILKTEYTLKWLFKTLSPPFTQIYAAYFMLFCLEFLPCCLLVWFLLVL